MRSVNIEHALREQEGLGWSVWRSGVEPMRWDDPAILDPAKKRLAITTGHYDQAMNDLARFPVMIGPRMDTCGPVVDGDHATCQKMVRRDAKPVERNVKRLGIFGGSFDPVHVGHLWIGEAALDSLGLERLDWIPTATQPLKPGGPVASSEDRLAMLRLALSGDSKHRIDDREVKRGEESYTVDTIEEIRGEHPEAEILFIIGGDSLRSIRKWKDPERLLRLALPAVVRRGGEPELDFSVLDGLVEADRIDTIRKHVIEMPVIEISSSDLRDRIRNGRRIRYRTPRAVEALIEANGLYR